MDGFNEGGPGARTRYKVQVRVPALHREQQNSVLTDTTGSAGKYFRSGKQARPCAEGGRKQQSTDPGCCMFTVDTEYWTR